MKWYEEDKLFRKDLASNILGGEALVWGYDVEDDSMELKLWPRGIALAERLWSNPSSGKDYRNH